MTQLPSNTLINATPSVQTLATKPTTESAVTESTVVNTPVLLLDGGMGRELEQRGAPFRQPEWSALALTEAPDIILATHLDFLKAGADIITINSYAITPFHLGDRFYSEGIILVTTAAELAYKAVQSSKTAAQVAACLPPLFGSYRPDLFDSTLAVKIAQPLLEGQADVANLWLAETVSSIEEATTWYKLVKDFESKQDSQLAAASEDDAIGNKRKKKPFWVAFTLDDSELDSRKEDNNTLDNDCLHHHLLNPFPRSTLTLRSGESITAAIHAMLSLEVDAILFNCSQPEVMTSALSIAKEIIEAAGSRQKLGVYANAFQPQQSHKQANADLRSIRQDTTPDIYLAWANQWRKAGAEIIGGCCGIGVEHIAKLAEGVTTSNQH